MPYNKHAFEVRVAHTRERRTIMNMVLYLIGQLIVSWVQPRNRVVNADRRIFDLTAGTDRRREASHAPDQIIIHLSI